MSRLSLQVDADRDEGEHEDPSVSLEVYIQTVQTFSGIVGRNLVLRRGPGFKTNGTVIEVNPAHEVGYHILEHEIAHILFKSDAAARETFVGMYVGTVKGAFVKARKSFNEPMFRQFLYAVIGNLEDRRVNSLWSDLYPGSAKILRDWMRKDMSKARGTAALPQLLSERQVDLIRGKASDKERAIGELFSTAYRMVDRRGFAATLIASRWLVTQLVTFFVAPDAPPQPPPRDSRSGGGGGGAENDDADDDLDADDLDSGDDSGSGSSSSKASQSKQSSASAASGQQRIEAMGALLDALARTSYTSSTDVAANDFEETGLTSKASEALATRLAKDILSGIVEESEQACEATSQAMQDIVNEVRDQLGLNVPLEHDDWLRRDLKASIVFTDIAQANTHAVVLSAEQRITVQRLRAHFMRVIGSQAIALESVGTDIDVRAYIDRRVTKEPLPFFKAETNGRGFEALIVLDRSGSMRGQHHNEVNKACQMLAEALNFPFVKLRVWGFNSPDNGVVRISRFARGSKGFASENSSSSGRTPLHVATQLAIRELLRGKGVRHLFMLTDGCPDFSALNGGIYSPSAMRDMTRKAVVQGKRVGVNTTGVVLGSSVTDADMTSMFVSERQWARFDDAERFCADLFNLVLSNFGAYLRSR